MSLRVSTVLRTLAAAVRNIFSRSQVPTRLYPHDYLPYKLYAHDGTYAYGLKDGADGGQGYRLDSSYNETALAPIDTIAGQSASSDIVGFICLAGVLFVQMDDRSAGAGVTSKRYLARSTDLGATWTPCTLSDGADTFVNGEIGRHGATHASNITILGDRGMCAATIDGATVLFFGEYNTNASRIAGGANDWVRIWKSTDLGATFTVAMEWNTSGHQVRHCHYIKQDPFYPQYIWVGNGDNPGTAGTEGGGGFIRWDVTVAPTWTNNWDYSTNTATPAGFKPSSAYTGVLRNREMCTDLIFTEDWIYNPADWGNRSTGPDDIGIWRFDRDMTVYQNVDRSNMALQLHSQYWGLRTANGMLVSTEIKDGTSDHNIYVYTSANGKTWYRSGVILIDATAGSTTGGLAGLFEWNGKVYMSFSNPAGKQAADAICTIVLDPVGDFNDYGPEPEVLSPVYWVSNSGSNSGADPTGVSLYGYSSRYPWQTPLYALTGSRIGRGARVIIKAGTYSGAGVKDVDPVFKSTNAPDAGFYTTVEGEGKGVTILAADPTAAYLFNHKDSSLISRVSDLTAYATRAGAGKLTSTQSLTLDVEYRRCVLGSKAYTPTNNVYANVGKIKLTQCECYAHDATTNLATSGTGTGGTIEFNSTLVDGGLWGTYHNGISLYGNNNSIVNYVNAAAENTAAATNLPSFRNTIMFSNHASNTYYYKDNRAAGSSYAAVPFDFCYTNKRGWITTTGVNDAAWTAGAHNQARNTALPFTSATDFTVPAGSGAYRTGRHFGIKNLSGEKQTTNYRPNIGAN